MYALLALNMRKDPAEGKCVISVDFIELSGKITTIDAHDWFQHQSKINESIKCY